MSRFFMVASTVTSVVAHEAPVIIKAESYDITEERHQNIKVSQNKKNIQHSSTTVLNSRLIAYTNVYGDIPEVKIIHKEVTQLEKDTRDYLDFSEEFLSSYYPKTKVSNFTEFKNDFVQFESSNKMYDYHSDDAVTTYDTKGLKQKGNFYTF